MTHNHPLSLANATSGWGWFFGFFGAFGTGAASVATSPPNIQYRHSLCHQLTHHIDTSTVLTASSITTTTTNDSWGPGLEMHICFEPWVCPFLFFLLHY
jgi:hypothetical protein